MKSFAYAVAAVIASSAVPVAAAPILVNSNADGFVAAGNAAGNFVLSGGDNQTSEAGFTSYADIATFTQTIFGTFGYSTNDGAVYDPAGYVVNGSRVQLTNNAGLNSQNGSFSFLVNAGDEYGFYVNTTDNIVGRGNIAVMSNAFTAAVPEPATWAMMLLGFGMIGAAVRYRRRGNVVFA